MNFLDELDDSVLCAPPGFSSPFQGNGSTREEPTCSCDGFAGLCDGSACSRDGPACSCDGSASISGFDSGSVVVLFRLEFATTASASAKDLRTLAILPTKSPNSR